MVDTGLVSMESLKKRKEEFKQTNNLIFVYMFSEGNVSSVTLCIPNYSSQLLSRQEGSRIKIKTLRTKTGRFSMNIKNGRFSTESKIKTGGFSMKTLSMKTLSHYLVV